MNTSQRKRTIFILAAGILLASAVMILVSRSTRAAGPWYVAPGGSDGNACTSPGAACATINGAIAKASSGDTIYVATGTYTGTGGSEVVLLDKDATLSGGWDGGFTTQSGISTIDGEDARLGITVNSGVTVTVEHLAVQNGYSSEDGGIYNGGVLTLNNSTVSGNSGSGIRTTYGTTLILNNSIVSDNTEGGIDSGFYCKITLNNSIVSGNAGGGIRNRGTLTLNNSTIRDNVADDGGGIYNSCCSPTVVLNNSTVTGNAAEHGGGIRNEGGTLTLNNSTVSENAADSDGGGIFNHGTVTLRNSILAGNMASNGPDCASHPIGSAGYNLIGNTSDCSFSSSTGDLTDVDPNLGQLIAPPGIPRYYPLLPGSPAIDAGNPAGCTDHLGSPLSTDQRGVARVGRCDIGAYEYTIPGPASSISAFSGTPQHASPFAVFETPLQALVLDSIGSPVSNTVVAFFAPASGASGTFADTGTFTTTAATEGGGLATAATFTANGLLGSYAVTATVSGVVTPAHFLLGNVVWYVSPDGNDGYACQTPTMPCATINGALGKPDFVSGDTVLVASGAYTGTGDEVVLLDKGARLLGGWDADFAMQSDTSTVDGEKARRGIVVNSNVIAYIERFTVQNGLDSDSSNPGGNGILNDGGTLTLSKCTIVGNGDIANGDSGGGIYSTGVLTLTGSIVSDNATACNGNGVYNNGGVLVANNSTISGNVGGGLYCAGIGVMNSGVSGIMTLSNTLVSDNEPGGGIYNHNNNILTLNNSTVSGNTRDGWHGGGILNLGDLTLNNSSVSDNTATEGGGGISNGDSGTVILNNSTVSGNTTTFATPPKGGGGIFSASGTVILNNSTVSGNTAWDKGGGISNSGTLTITNSTINNNTTTGYSGGSGGGIYNDSGTVAVQNTIVAGNTTPGTGPDCSGTIGSLGYNLIGDTSDCTFTPATGDLTNVDAQLAPLEGSPAYHPLISGSPAINAGNPGGCTDHLSNPLTTDQRGAPRVGRCDVGAYEAGLAVAKQVNGMFNPGGSLTYVITLSNEEGDTNLTNVSVTDTLPIYLTYVTDSYTATNGIGGESDGVITWSGTVLTDTDTVISFSAIISDEARCSVIANTAVINHGGSYEFERQAVGTTPCNMCDLTKEASNPILTAGTSGSWDDDGVWSPTVLKEGSIYRLWYTGGDGSNPSQIGLATSSDGIAWVKEAANPVLSPSESWETGGIVAGSVISDSGVYKMWYTGYDSSGIGRIGYATSSDGITWIKHGGNPVLDVGTPGGWEDSDVTGPTVLKEDSTYHMWYTGDDGVTPRIGYATSSNGIYWIKNPTNPILDLGPPGGWDWLYVYGPSAVTYNDAYLLWYSGGTLPAAWQTGYAVSLDGSGWSQGKMFIPEGTSGAFDANSADLPSVIVDGDVFKVWYSGLNSGGSYSIGYASAEICSTGAGLSNTIYLPLTMRTWSPCGAYYTDGFSDPGSGWPVDDNGDRGYAYTGGQYQIWVKKPSQGWLVTPGAKATDFAVEVSARRTSGSYGVYGIVFGINEDWSERYQVHIDAGSYSIWKYAGGWTALQNWTPSGYINTGTNWNRLKVVRDGASIALYVNGYHLTTVTDGSFTGLRRIGLLAYSPSSGPLDARFDDFVLYPASCDGSGAASTMQDRGTTLSFEMGTPGIYVAAPPGRPRPPKRNQNRDVEWH